MSTVSVDLPDDKIESVQKKLIAVSWGVAVAMLALAAIILLVPFGQDKEPEEVKEAKRFQAPKETSGDKRQLREIAERAILLAKAAKKSKSPAALEDVVSAMAWLRTTERLHGPELYEIFGGKETFDLFMAKCEELRKARSDPVIARAVQAANA